jgi:hypothetical protein
MIRIEHNVPIQARATMTQTIPAAANTAIQLAGPIAGPLQNRGGGPPGGPPPVIGPIVPPVPQGFHNRRLTGNPPTAFDGN